jgi:hypothetical protein
VRTASEPFTSTDHLTPTLTVVGLSLRHFVSLGLVLLGHKVKVKVKEREGDCKLARGVAEVGMELAV